MSRDDRWLLPRHQTEYPARDLVAETKLHGRREATYLALATFVLVATAALLMTPPAIVDLTAWVTARLSVHVPAALLVPVGVLPSALGMLAVMLACELYGRRRAAALVCATMAASIGLLALVRVVATGAALNFTLALASGYLIAHVTSLITFAALRRRLAGRHLVSRVVLTSVVAQPLGWAVFGAVAYGMAPGSDVDRIAALALGSAAVTTAGAIVAIVPLAIAARVLAIYLRVARQPVEGLPPAVIVDEDDAPAVLARPRAQRAPIAPYSPAELRFFTEGDQLGETAT